MLVALLHSAFSSKSVISAVYSDKVLHQISSDNSAKKHWDDKIRRPCAEDREMVLLPYVSVFPASITPLASTYGKWKRHVRNIRNKGSSCGRFCKKCGCVLAYSRSVTLCLSVRRGQRVSIPRPISNPSALLNYWTVCF